jgi:HSP20 family protein
MPVKSGRKTTHDLQDLTQINTVGACCCSMVLSSTWSVKMANSGTNLTVKEGAKAPALGLASGQSFDSIRREFDRLFGELDRNLWLAPFSLFNGPATSSANGDSDWFAVPAVDVVEKPDAYEITAEMPGMDEKDIEVSLVDGGISIHGEKRQDKADESAGRYVRERRFGSFERSFALPDDVSAEHIQANYANGVLRVKLPKNPNAQSPKRRIPVTKN